MDTVSSGMIIDRLTGRKITDHGFVFLAIAEERDTYDREAITVYELTRDDGRMFRSVRDISTHDASLIGDGIIWREALDGALRCSDRFKAIYDEIGCRGVRFQPTKMSTSTVSE